MAKSVVLTSVTFSSRKDATAYFQSMLHKYKPGDRVNNSDEIDLKDLLDRHPASEDKIGAGVDHFEVQEADFGTQCFRVVRLDGTWARFSFKVCISPELGRD